VDSLKAYERLLLNAHHTNEQLLYFFPRAKMKIKLGVYFVFYEVHTRRSMKHTIYACHGTLLSVNSLKSCLMQCYMGFSMI
jgi:hypothetical protein